MADTSLEYSERGAILSDDGLYRFCLWRRWDRSKATVTFIMLNPSTADAEQDDPTIRKCKGFAYRWNCGSIIVVNIFAYRATKPRDLFTAGDSGVDIIGGFPNALWLGRAARIANNSHGRVVCAWGHHGRFYGGTAGIIKNAFDPWCLGLTKNGQPKHPLMLPYDTAIEPFL